MKAPVSAGWLAMLVANLAKHYLLDPSLELAETACLLEYEDPNSFFRAWRAESRCRPICVNLTDRITRKMEASSIAGFVRMAEKLGAAGLRKNSKK